MVSTWLRDAGYQVLAVQGASQALLQTGESRLSLIILDLDLGGENGLMLMKYLKRNHPGVPIILYTGMQHDEEAVQHMRAAGAQQYLRKGAKEDLLQAVKGFLG